MAARKNQKKGAPRRRNSTLSLVKQLGKDAQTHKKKVTNEGLKLDVPAAPGGLCDIGKAEWDTMAKLLVERGEMDRKYHMPLEMYCDAVATYRKAGIELQKKGEDVILKGKKGGAGGRFRNPWYDIRMKAEEKIYKYLSLFGMSPLDDARIRGGKGDNSGVRSNNPFDNL